jgi:hypothetical protein
MTGQYDTKEVGTEKLITLVYELTGDDASENMYIASSVIT